MDSITVISSLGTLIIALIGVIIALLQLRSANHEAQASRIVEMSWQIYLAYVDKQLREARGAAEHIAHTSPVPSTGEEYGEKYADKSFFIFDDETASIDTCIRRLLRFYNQVGVLLEKKLVDEDMIFSLIGAGFRSVWPALKSALAWYQNCEPNRSVIIGLPQKSHSQIFYKVYTLHDLYIKWEKKQVMRARKETLS